MRLFRRDGWWGCSVNYILLPPFPLNPSLLFLPIFLPQNASLLPSPLIFFLAPPPPLLPRTWLHQIRCPFSTGMGPNSSRWAPALPNVPIPGILGHFPLFRSVSNMRTTETRDMCGRWTIGVIRSIGLICQFRHFPPSFPPPKVRDIVAELGRDPRPRATIAVCVSAGAQAMLRALQQSPDIGRTLSGGHKLFIGPFHAFFFSKLLIFLFFYFPSPAPGLPGRPHVPGQLHSPRPSGPPRPPRRRPSGGPSQLGPDGAHQHRLAEFGGLCAGENWICPSANPPNAFIHCSSEVRAPLRSALCADALPRSHCAWSPR